MPIPEKLTQIPVLWTRDLHAGKAIFHQQSQKELGILAIVLLLADSHGPNLRRVSNPQLVLELLQEPFEPACVPSGFNADPHDPVVQPSVKSLRLSVAVYKSAFVVFSSLAVDPGDLLKAWVIVASYNDHVRLLPPEPWSSAIPSLLRSREPTLL
jgi:hypothetical protein